MTEPADNERKRRIHFESAPVNEVVIGLYHVPIIELRSQHIGIYWNTIRDKYPLCEQQPPIVQAVEGAPEQIDLSKLLQQMDGEVYPLPRFWFFSEAHSTLIQVQRNAFWLNWRRGEGVYPHYESVEKDFWTAFEGYKSFVEGALEGKLDVVKRCELTYVNLIGTSNFFSCPAEIKHVLPPTAGLCDVQDEARRLAGLNVSATYQLTDHLRIESSVRLGRRKDKNEDVALFDLKALGTPKDLSLDGARAWYKVAHDAIYDFFLYFTDKEVQKELWKPR